MTCVKNSMTFEHTRDHPRTILLSRSIKAKKFSTGNKSMYMYLSLKHTCCILKGCKQNKEKIFERDYRDVTQSNMTIVFELFNNSN